MHVVDEFCILEHIDIRFSIYASSEKYRRVDIIYLTKTIKLGKNSWSLEGAKLYLKNFTPSQSQKPA